MPTAYVETDLYGAIGLIRQTVLDCRFVPPVSLVGDNSLIARIRGTWGRHILDSDLESVEATEMRKAFFGRGVDHHVRPWLISMSTTDIYLDVRLTLFGSASRWQTLAFDSFLAALTEGEGLRWSSDKKAGATKLRLVEASLVRNEWLEVGQHLSSCRLRTRTPLRLIARGSIDSTCGTLIPAIARRLCDLAPWSFCRVRGGIADTIRSAKNAVITSDSLRPACWTRNSTRRAGQYFHLGLVGELVVSNLDELGYALLKVGTIIGAGTEVSLGMGQFEIMALGEGA